MNVRIVRGFRVLTARSKLQRNMGIGLAMLVMLTLATSSLALSGLGNDVEFASVDVGGTVAGINNVTFLPDDTRALIASVFSVDQSDSDENEPEESGEAGSGNRFVHLIDTEHPLDAPVSTSLGILDPSKVLFDKTTNTVFVRGTDLIDGQQVECVAHVHLNKENGFDGTVVKFGIKAPTKEWGVKANYSGAKDFWATMAPHDLAVGGLGKFLVFTNGASYFTYSLEKGYVYNIDLVAPRDFDPETHTISSVDIDPDTDIIVSTVRRVSRDGDDPAKVSSEIYFHQLIEEGPKAGTVDLIKRISSDALPAGTSLTLGSNVVLNEDSSEAFFMVDDGSLCATSLISGGSEGTIRVLATFGELASADNESAGPRLVFYDAGSRTVGVLGRGHHIQIRRPLFRDPTGRIRRPLFGTVRIQEAPMVGLVRLGKKGRVADQRSVSDFGEGEIGFSNPVLMDSTLLIGNSRGELLSVDIESAEVAVVGQASRGIDSLSFNPDNGSLVGISSFLTDDEGNVQRGTVFVGHLDSSDGESAQLSRIFSFVTLRGLVAANVPSLIRRPCSIGR